MTKSKTTKFYTVAGFSRVGGCIEPCTYADIFQTRNEAAKFVAKKINRVFSDEGFDCSVTAKECTEGYGLSGFDDADGMFVLSIVEHSIGPVHAVVTFDQDDRTLNITTVKDRKEAQARVAYCAKAYLADSYNCPEYVYVDRDGGCNIEPDELTDSEPYVQVETTSGNFTAWTAVEIPVFGKADIDVQ